jgi:hypothetical protein
LPSSRWRGRLLPCGVSKITRRERFHDAGHDAAARLILFPASGITVSSGGSLIGLISERANVISISKHLDR